MTIDHEAIRVGDILKTPSGLLRVVRRVSRYRHRDGRKRNPARSVWCNFIIQHCSWTHRPYTCYSVGEMNQLKWEHTGKRMKLNTEFDRLLESDFEADRSEDCMFTCCSVEGIG